MTVPATGRPAPPDLPPRFHIRAPGSWINDPNGPVFWNGGYHLFFQRSRLPTDWDSPSWGHATSPDLVHWTVLDDALTPTPGGPDAGGCWSGCCVTHDGLVYAFYTGVDADQLRPAICLATSDGDLTTWHKVPEPVIPAPPSGVEPQLFRDPFVVRDGDRWLCLVGAGMPGAGGVTLLYASGDLLSWEYCGPLFPADGSPLATKAGEVAGEMWECPQLFPLGDRHVLGISVVREGRLDHSSYFLGEFRGRRFTASSSGRLDHGPDYYAATSMADPAGRRLMWGWSWEALTDPARRAGTAAGCLTVPREVSLHDGEPWIQPIRELAALRGAFAGAHQGTLSDTTPVTLTPSSGTSFDVEVTVVPRRASCVELEVYAAPYGIERTLVFLDARDGVAGVDTTSSTLFRDARTGVYTTPVDGQPDRPVHLRVLGDGTIVEVFVDGRPFTVRVYPTRDDSRSIRLRAHGGNAEVIRSGAWTITERAVRARPADPRRS